MRNFYNWWKKEGKHRFCNEGCHYRGWYIINADHIPEETIYEHAKVIHESSCPLCHKTTSPVDVHTSYRVWSALIVTQWSNNPQISCRSCGIKSQSNSALFSLLLGWWGVPWGVLVTPAQIVKNVIGLINPPSPHAPSKDLERMVRIDIGKYIYIKSQENNNA